VRRKRIFIILAVCVLVGIGVVAFWRGEREPEYNGKKLSAWLTVAAGQGWDEPDSSETLQALAAVRSIGTNALPCLVKWIQFEQPKWRKDISTAYQKFPRGLYNESIALWLLSHDEKGRRLAPLGFGILGPAAGPAVPDLVNLLKQPRKVQQKKEIIFCLGNMRGGATAALSYLQQFALDPKSELRDDAGFAMENIEPGIFNRLGTNVGKNF
jgi:hypothetical protein